MIAKKFIDNRFHSTSKCFHPNRFGSQFLTQIFHPILFNLFDTCFLATGKKNFFNYFSRGFRVDHDRNLSPLLHV